MCAGEEAVSCERNREKRERKIEREEKNSLNTREIEKVREGKLFWLI